MFINNNRIINIIGKCVYVIILVVTFIFGLFVRPPMRYYIIIIRYYNLDI